MVKDWLKKLQEKKDLLHKFKNRRKHFFINKPLQLRYMAFTSIPLLIISMVLIIGLYHGVWASVFEAFSNDRLRYELLSASQMKDYEHLRPGKRDHVGFSLSFFKQAEKLNRYQREAFKEILDETNRKIAPKLFLLILFLAWGSIYVSHKIAGPLYRFSKILEDLEKGNLQARINLRKYDEGKILARQFNNALIHLDTTFSRLKHIIKENESDPERMTARLKEELSKIKTSSEV